MMRKGPIDRYPVAQTLRLAAAEALTGSIRFEAATSGTIFLENGYVYFAALDGVPAPVDMAAAERPPKGAVRRYVESVLCVLYDLRDGWYTYERLGRHPDGVRWVFGVDGLDRAVHARLAEHEALRAWGRSPIVLEPASSATIRVSAEMWAVVTAMASPTSSHELRDRLGWEPDRLALALGDLGRVGLVAAPTEPDPPPLDPPAAPDPPAQPTPPGLDLVPRPLPTLTRTVVREPVAVGSVVGGGPTVARTTVAPADPPVAAPVAPVGAADAVADRAAAVPAAASADGGPTRKSALKRLINSLRQ